MDDSWLTLVLLGLAASFMPMVFGVEIYALGADDGTKKVSSLLGGITMFRLVIMFAVMLLVAGVLTALTQELADIRLFLGSLLLQIGDDVTSGQHLVVDLLLIVAGLFVIVQAVRRLRGASNTAQAPQSDESKALEVGVIGMLGLGVVMTATNVNQWIFISAAVNELLRMQIQPWGRLLALLLFLALSSVMVLLPLVLVLARPQKASADLEKVNGWINGSMRYVVTGILILIGLYLMAKGGIGVVNFLSG